MATFAELKELRLKISDPSGVIDILSVANAAELPAVPARQTAYLEVDTGDYVLYDFDLAEWNVLPLKISDSRLANFIDLWGTADSVTRAIRAIMATLVQAMQIKRFTSGADSTEYLTLKDAYECYKMLIEQYMQEDAQDEGTSTGRYLRMRTPGSCFIDGHYHFGGIAGGMR